jgi:hypothetical protein
MAINVEKLKRQRDRWYPLKPVPEQIKLIESDARFKIVPAGRRSGKTERAKRYLAKVAAKIPGLYFIAAPTYNQVKKIYWDDMLDLCLTAMQNTPPHKSDLIIYFNNGSEIHFIGLDKPTRFEGPAWDGGIIDEAAYLKKEVLDATVFPALDTENPTRPGYRPWAWIIGKPSGRNHFYDLFKYARSGVDSEYAAFHWTSDQVLSPEAIAKAKSRLPPKLFRQEYLASFETQSGLIYDDYCELNHTNETIRPEEAIHYFCDFNYTPMSHGIGVVRGDSAYLLDEIILTGAKAEMSALEFTEKYKDHVNKTIYVYGDASGHQGAKHGLDSDYIMMEKIFKTAGWKVELRTPISNPAIKDRQNSVRGKIMAADGTRTLFVNPSTAPWTDKGLDTVQLKEGSTFQEDDRNEYQHITTAIGYWCYELWPIEEDYEYIPMYV